MADERLQQFETKMNKTFANLESEFQSIRAGRANPHVLDKIKVDYYGTPTPIQQVGNVSVPEPRMLQIAPWDKSLIKPIEKAILTSDIGINPSNDGTVIRLIFPELTEERRKDLAKDVKKKGEAAKVAIRNIRRDANDTFKKMNKANELTEDDQKDLENKLQKMTDKFIADIDKAVDAKTKDIMKDGNGRWAKAKGMPRNYGHMEGAKTVEKICEEAWRIGIKYLTVYAFSTENWKRPQEEVDALMKLLRNYMKTCLKTAAKNDMVVRVIGDKTGLADDIRESIEELEKASANNGGLNFQIAINYGSRDEIVRSVRKVMEDVKAGKIEPEQMDEAMFDSYLDTAGIPSPDLLIRTSGEQRLSNFLMWQLAYTEFYFTDVPWPAFTKEDLEKAIEKYNSRDRRFGGVKEA